MSVPSTDAKPLDLGLDKPLDELFMDDQGRAENRLPRIYDIPLSEIDDFPDHPYQVRLDEDMDQLVESIKELGIITPAKLRKLENGRFEMIAGHRRKKACELIGLPTIRAEVLDITRDEAIILMVDSNLQRSHILPCEKGKAIKMRLEAMKRQAGRPSQENCSPVENNFSGKRSSELLAEEIGESKAQIFRYIRLNELVPGLANLVDEGKIAMRPAVELSYLKEDEQKELLENIAYQDATPSLAQAIKMKKFSQEERLTPEVIESIMTEEKPNQAEKFSIRMDRLRRWIPREMTQQQTEEFIMKALDHYSRFLQKQKIRGEDYDR